MVETVIGQFEDLEKLLHAGRRLKERGYQITTLSPVSIHEQIEPLLGEKKNPIRYLTFTGAIAGFFFGILLTTIPSVLYPLPRGGRPIFFVPPIVILSYETTILFGVLSTLVGFVLFSGLPSFNRKPYIPVAMVGSYALLVENPAENYEEIEKIMVEAGAGKVHRHEK
jgi:hypothetical protein